MKISYVLVNKEGIASQIFGCDNRFSFQFYDDNYLEFLGNSNILLFKDIESAEKFKNKYLNLKDCEIYKIVTPDFFRLFEEGECNIEIIGNGKIKIEIDRSLAPALNKFESPIRNSDGETFQSLNNIIYTILELESGYASISKSGKHDEGYWYNNIEVGIQCHWDNESKTITYYWKIQSEDGGKDCDGRISRYSFYMSMGGFRSRQKCYENWQDEFSEEKYNKLWKFNSEWEPNVFGKEKNYVHDENAERAGY